MFLRVSALVSGLMILSINAWSATFQQAENLYLGKQFGQARQAYQEVARETQITTMAATAKVCAAICLYDQKDYDGFKNEAETLLTQVPGKGVSKVLLTKYRLANIPLRQGKWAEAAESLGQFAAENSKCEYTFDALNNQAKALGKLNRHREARKIYLDHISRSPESTFTKKAKLKAALCLYHMGDLASFTQEGQAVIKQYPAISNEDAEWVRLHLAQMPGKREGRWLESARQLESLLTAAPIPKVTLYHVRIDCGQAYLKAAIQMKHSAATSQSLEIQNKGRTYLLEARAELEGQLAADRKKATNADLRMMILESYYFDRNFAGLAQAAQTLAADQPTSSPLWAQGKIYLGVARLSQTPPDYTGAAQALDAVLAADLVDHDLRRHTPTMAAYWRAFVAQKQKDKSKYEDAITRLKTMPENPFKKIAYARYAVKN